MWAPLLVFHSAEYIHACNSMHWHERLHSLPGMQVGPRHHHHHYTAFSGAAGHCAALAAHKGETKDWAAKTPGQRDVGHPLGMARWAAGQGLTFVDRKKQQQQHLPSQGSPDGWAYVVVLLAAVPPEWFPAAGWL
jgi:hypothetical protein